MEEQLDPQVKNLVTAIGRAETGENNPNAYSQQGKSGEFGRYQFMPATYKAYAKKYIGDENAQPTVENQNKIAYSFVKEKKDAGFTPAQIASMWNAGEGKPNAYKESFRGVNELGVQYDTPGYVQNVSAHYNKIKGQSAQTPTTVNNVEQQKQELRAKGEPVSTKENRAQPTFAGNIARGLLKLPARFGASLLGLGAGALALGGSKEAAQSLDELAKKGIKSDYLGTVRPIGFTDDTGEGMNLKDTLGAGLEGASYVVGGGGAANIAKQGLKGLIKQGAIQGLKSGATSGALGGAGTALQEGKGAGETLMQTGLGVAAGGVLGGALGGAGGVLQKGAGLAKKGAQIGGLSKIDDEVVRKAEQEIAREYERALPLTAKQRSIENMRRTKNGESTFDTLAKQRIELKQNPDGTINPEVLDNLDDVSEQFANAADIVHKNEPADFNLDEMRKNAYKNIDENIPGSTARKTAKAKIDTEIEDLFNEGVPFIKNQKGDRLVKSDVMERLRKTGNNWTPYNSADPEKIGSSTGFALANAVRDQVEKEGTFASYRMLNKEWGKILHAKDTLQKVVASGKKVKSMGGLSGEIARKVLTGGLGLHSGGIAGLILAEMGGDLAARVLTDPSLRTSLERAIIRNSGSKLPKNEIIQKVLQEVEEAVQKQAGLPRLPAPSYMEGKPYKGSSQGELQVTKGLLPIGMGRVE